MAEKGKVQGDSRGLKWLLFFYSVPSKPAGNRVKVWRKLSRAGAVQLKGAVYILPYSEEHYELLQWLSTEIDAMAGESAFTITDKIETLPEEEIVELFNRQRENDYRALEKDIAGLETVLSSFRKGTSVGRLVKHRGQLGKLKRDFHQIRKTDFFSSETGRLFAERLRLLESGIEGLAPAVKEKKKRLVAVKMRKAADYQGRYWMTRKKPFIDRIASAWLIKDFIDRHAAFDFIEESDVGSLGKGAVAFDVKGGEFTHAGDMCTFEVLLKAFGLNKDMALKKVAEIVHELDLNDGKYSSAESDGLSKVIAGIRKSEHEDSVILEKGMIVFRMLYVSLTK